MGDINASSNVLSKDSYFESFETFLQNLAPLKLSHDIENSENAFPLAMVPKSLPSSQVSPSDLSCRGGRGTEGDNASKDEVTRLQELVELLQVRLDALQRALEIQEQEVCREMGAAGGDNSCPTYEKLLTRWRREVCVMLLKQRVDALQFEQRQLQHTKKEHHLTVQLHEARALVEVLKQKERNSQAEIAILTTSTKVAEMTMRAEGARRQHEMEGALKTASKATMEAISQTVESQVDMLSVQMGRITDALCRLDMHGRRLFFAEQQVAMAAGLISSNFKPQGSLSFRKRGDGELPSLSRRKEYVTLELQKTMDHVGRANQLEVLLSATKTQLAEECLHARELQERLGKSEVESRETTKRVLKKVQEQADRDLAAIKRQHGQTMQSLQQKVVKLQADQARGIVSQHQLERKICQQQQEFTQTLNQRDLEFKKSLEAKELEISNLLNEQNALLVKLKKFWRPILNSSSAKVLQEKNTRSSLHTQESSTAEKMNEKNPRNVLHTQESSTPADQMKTPRSVRERKDFLPNSVETQTDEDDIAEDNMCHCTTSPPNEARYEDCILPQDREIFPHIKEKVTSCSRLSTPSRKHKHSSRAGKKNDDDLIASYLTKLQKAYVKSRHVSSDPFITTLPIDTVLARSNPTIANNGGSPPLEPRHTPRSSVDSKESCEINDARSDNLARYVICIPRRESCSPAGNTFFLKTRRKKKVVGANHFLRVKLENLEDLSMSLLNKGHHF
ncbi:unnamed protein product [Calypogeia fissa]